MPFQFAVGVKLEKPDASIMYVRRTNERGGARHMQQKLAKAAKRS